MVLLRAHLSPKKLITKLHINKLAFDYIISNITQQFFNSISKKKHVNRLGIKI